MEERSVGGKKRHDEAPFSDEQLAAIAGVVWGLLDKALSKPGPSNGTDEAGRRAGESGWEDT